MCDIPFGKVSELSTDQWKGVIHDASRLGAETIVFSGGEPLIREDIFDLVRFARKNNMNACITSNGLLLDEEKAAKLKESAVSVVNISIEGVKETHDSLRGSGSFDKALAALDNLKKYKIESTVASTVSKYNYADLPDIVNTAKVHGSTTVRLQPFNIIFLKDPKRLSEFLIDKNDIPKVEGIIKRFIDSSREYKIATNPSSYLAKIPVYLSGRKLRPRSCSALWYSCPINPNGDVFPCWIEGADNKLIGNITQSGLYELWLSEKRISAINLIKEKGCKGCLMSCYDEAFDNQLSKEYVISQAKKIKKIIDYRKVINKTRQFLNRQLTNLKLRYRFYVSYRGSFFKLIKRRLANVYNKQKETGDDRMPNKEKILLEISKAKIKINKEIQSL